MRTIGILLLLFALVADIHGSTFTVTTSAHPLPSFGIIEVYAGDLPPSGLLVFRSPRLAFDGGGTLTTNFDATQTGPFQTSLNLRVEDLVDFPVDLGPLGSFTLTSLGLTLGLQTGDILATNSAYALGPGTARVAGSIGINAGSVNITNTAGAIGTLYPQGFFYDFTGNLSAVNLSALLDRVDGSVDAGTGLFSPRAELNIGNPDFMVRTFILSPFLLRIIPEIHLAAIPEASTFLLSAVAASLFLGTGLWYRRHRGET
ncbi:hypothetical protein K2X85_12615 [bacterium]|nr:hypothetical protein [bacterium]